MTGMMTSFSLPGLPSLFSLRISSAPCGAELRANASFGDTAAITPREESVEAMRAANALRVNVRFIKSPLKFIVLIRMRSRQCKTENIATRGNRHILSASDRIAHRGRTDVLPRVEVPQRLAVSRVYGFKRTGIVPEKHKTAGRRHSAGR